jgi:hypothetical protein
MRDIYNIATLTGPSISAESGVPTFRSKKSGTSYWGVNENDHVPKGHRVDVVAYLPLRLARASHVPLAGRIIARKRFRAAAYLSALQPLRLLELQI